MLLKRRDARIDGEQKNSTERRRIQGFKPSNLQLINKNPTTFSKLITSIHAGFLNNKPERPKLTGSVVFFVQTKRRGQGEPMGNQVRDKLLIVKKGT